MTTSNTRRIDYIPLDDIREAPANPKRHELAAIRASVARFGFVTPGLRDERTGLLIAGHGRAKALREIRADGEAPPDGVRIDDTGQWLIPVICGWASRSDAEAAAYLVIDNHHPTIGGWDNTALAELLHGVADVDPDLVAVVGIDLDALDALLEPDPGQPEMLGDPDATPLPPTHPTSAPGDVWILGPHRLFCGDSTDPATWDLLLQGERPALVFTDPPYGIGYQAMRGGKAIANDSNAEEALQVTRDALALLYDAEAHFVCCDWRSLGTIVDAMIGAAIEPKACIVWDKQSRVQNLDRYAKQHEFIVYAGPYGGQPTQCTDVWVHQRDFKPDHPTPKPVSLIEQALNSASQPGGIVADAFGGSGSTLIAAHATGRAARVVELDPRYVDVICRRFQEFTGIKPVRGDTGEAVDFTQPPANQ